MMTIFKRQRLSYGKTPVPETPFQKAGELWDRRMGSAIKQAHNWRIMAFLSFGLIVFLTITLITYSSRSHITPYVVEVDSLGQARAIGPVSEPYSPSDAIITYQLSNFIGKVRSLPSDPVILRNNWLKAYDFVTDQGANILNQYAAKNDPFEWLGKKTITVQVTNIVRASENSFQIKWQEEHFTNGSLSESRIYTAILSLVFEQARDVETLRKNPLGLYIHDLNWSRDFNLKALPNPNMKKGAVQ